MCSPTRTFARSSTRTTSSCDRSEVERERIALDGFLDLAACEGAERGAVYAEVERLLSLGQTAGLELRRTDEGYGLTLSVGWYLLERVLPPRPTTAT